MTWLPDPDGRHQERWHDGAGFTGRVRDHGVENEDSLGTARPTDPTPMSAPPAAVTSGWSPAPAPAVIAPPPASFGSTPRVPVATTASSTPAMPPTAITSIPPAGFTPPPVSTPRSPTLSSDSATSRKGIPAALALATIIAACPMLVLLAGGLMAVAAGSDISSTSRSSSVSSWNYEDWNIQSSTTPSQDLGALGSGTTEAGVWMIVIGAAGLLLAIGMATGLNYCRVLTALWIAVVTLYLAGNLLDGATGEAFPYLAVILGTPTLGLIAMFTPTSNEVFTDPVRHPRW